MTTLHDPMPREQAVDLACRAHVGVWAERRRQLVNGGLHWEWAELIMTASRLAVVAPREHAKSECFVVNQAAWRCLHTPGVWCYIFSQSGDQAKEKKQRIDDAVQECDPPMVDHARTVNQTETVYRNGARVTVAGAGKKVRGDHPDIVVGDDVLDEWNTVSQLQRRRVEQWWLGTVGGMCHPGTVRWVGRVRVAMPPTRVFLVGTPFHQRDLLMGMKANPLYQFRRYAAEFEKEDLKDGLAVEIG